MLGIAYLLLFELCGAGIAFLLLPRVRLVARIWLGLCLGLLLMMWLPALCAFICDFTLNAHLLALVPLFALVGGAYWGRDRRAPAPLEERDRKLLWLLLMTALPLTLLGAYLQWTHNIAPAEDGTWHVGQSTYGDLPLHLAIITSLRNASFPADYSILPGTLLSYPFLTDSLSTSLMLMGYSLRGSILLPGMLMTALVFSGYGILAERIADSRRGAALATAFFFLNGGLGFLYLIDMQGAVLGAYEDNQLQSVSGLWNRIEQVLTGWYQTPANHAEFSTYNLRWSNVICDMLVPQRTTLGGWCQLLPCLYLLYDAVMPDGARPGISMNMGVDGPTAVFVRREIPYRALILLGVWAGLMPMVHSHSFLALGMISLGWMAWDLIHAGGQRMRALAFWGIYGLIAVAIAAPQLFTWTFHQVSAGQRFLTLQFNWVNGKAGMLDNYLWFYIKNIGLPFLLILLALLEKNQKRRFLASGAFVVFIIAEFVVFTPNEYDNNKLFYVWYMLCAIIAADYGLELLGKLRGMRARGVIAALCAFVCFFTAALSIARECVSDYQMFSRDEVAAAEYVEDHTEEHATFLTWTQHINFVSSLAGRDIVCGPDSWLYYHGLNTGLRQAEIRAFYADPMGHLDTLERYGVDYILVSGSERYSLAIDTNALENNFERVYASDNGGIIIYAAPEE